MYRDDMSFSEYKKVARKAVKALTNALDGVVDWNEFVTRDEAKAALFILGKDYRDYIGDDREDE